MENWPEKFALIEVRKKSDSDQDFWRNTDRLRYLTAEVAIDHESFNQLQVWEQATAKAAAVGLTVDRAVIAGRAAARLWNIATLSYDHTVELMYLDGKQAGAKHTWPPGILHRRCNLRADEVLGEHGLRVTLGARTLRDIAAYHGTLEGLVAIDSARSQWPHLSKEFLSQQLLNVARYNGVGSVRQAIELSIPNSGSPLETKARYMIVTSDLPGIHSVEAQARIHVGASDHYFDVDLLINGWLVIELDGRHKLDGRTFGATDAVLRAERAREVFIQNTGKRVIRAGWEHLEPQTGGRIPLLDLIAEALRTHLVPVTF